jgi:hypothetical protein
MVVAITDALIHQWSSMELHEHAVQEHACLSTHMESL